MPNIIGTINIDSYATAYTPASSGAFANPTLLEVVAATRYSTASGTYREFKFDASLSNSIYGASDTVQPPSFSLIPQIKF